MGEVFKVIAIIVATLVCGTVALLSVGAGILSLNPEVRDTVDGFNFLLNQRVTLSEFEQIKVGMTYEQVVDILNREGDSHSSWSFEDEDGGKIEATTYTWENTDDSRMSTTYHNGKLISKSEQSLK